MNPAKLNPGSENLDAVAHWFCWTNDMANDLWNNDALWLYAAKASHKFVKWRGTGVMDPVLHCLFSMGLFDWSMPNDRLNQMTPAMCHATVMGTQLFSKMMENDTKVFLSFCLQ